MREPHIVYVLRSETAPSRYYTGITANLLERLKAHNAGLTRSTAAAGPWRVVVAIDFTDPKRAAEFELYLK